MQAARGASLSSSDPTSTPTGPSGRRGARKGALVVFASIAVVGYLTDLVSKVLAVEHLTGKAPVPVLGDWLTLYLARNPGAAFSTGTSYTLLLSLVAVAGVNLSAGDKLGQSASPSSSARAAGDWQPTNSRSTTTVDTPSYNGRC